MLTLLLSAAAIKATAAVITKATVITLAKKAVIGYAVNKTLDKTIDTIKKSNNK